MQVMYGDSNTFDALVGGLATPELDNYLAGMNHDFSRAVSGTVMDRIINSTASSMRSMNTNTVTRTMRSLSRQLDNIWKPDIIRELNDIGELQNAPNPMIRYLMAEPTVRRRYHQNRIAGYDDRYVDLQPGVVGEQHYDYRRVNQGLYQDGPNDEYRPVQYYDELHEDDRELNVEEQMFILSAHERLRAALDAGQEDPTSIYNAAL